MRLYPELPARRTATIVRDLVVLGLVILFAWVAMGVHDRIADLGALGRGVQDAGSAIDNGFGSAAGAVDGVPIVGGQLAEGLRAAGKGSGGNVAAAGREGEQVTDDLATYVGWVVFLMPTLLLLLIYLPWRIIGIRRLSAAHTLLRGPPTREHRRMLAMRAAFHLPYTAIAQYTKDPFGDLEHGRYDALVHAACTEAGLKPPEPLPPGA